MSRHQVVAGIARLHRPLMITATLMAALFVVSLGGLLLDDRQILNQPIWTKTFKFSVSMALYLATLAWMIGLLPRARRWGWWMGTVVAVGLGADVVLLVIQMIGRGRRLHFNLADETDRMIHNLVATGAYIAFAASVVIAGLLSFQRLRDVSQATAVRAGLGMALVGMATATLMFSATPDQQATIDAGATPETFGSHSIGAVDGGPGLPIVGWSTEGGDLRAAHFAGLHGIQLLPLLAIVLLMLSRRYHALGSATVRRALLRVTASGYLGVVLLLTWQALRGQSVVNPDAITLLCLAAIVGSMTAGWLLILRQAGRGGQSADSERASVGVGR